MKAKRIMALFCAAAMIAGLSAGCGAPEGTAADSGGQETGTEEGVSAGGAVSEYPPERTQAGACFQDSLVFGDCAWRFGGDLKLYDGQRQDVECDCCWRAGVSDAVFVLHYCERTCRIPQ